MNYAPVCSGIGFSAIMDLHEIRSELLTMDFCKEKEDGDFCSVTQDHKITSLPPASLFSFASAPVDNVSVSAVRSLFSRPYASPKQNDAVKQDNIYHNISSNTRHLMNGLGLIHWGAWSRITIANYSFLTHSVRFKLLLCCLHLQCWLTYTMGNKILI